MSEPEPILRIGIQIHNSIMGLSRFAWVPSCKVLSVETAVFRMFASVTICLPAWIRKTGHNAGENAVIPWILPNPDAIFFQDSPRLVEA